MFFYKNIYLYILWWPNSSKTIHIPFVPLYWFWSYFSLQRITPFNENLGRQNGITVYDNHTMISFQCSIAEVQLAKSWARHSRIVNLLANWGWQGNKHLAKLYIRTNRVQFRGQYSQRGSWDRTERGTEELTESLLVQTGFNSSRERVGQREEKSGYLLDILGPLHWFRHGHEAAVCQNSAHNEQTK